MINNLEGMSKAELLGVVKVQQEADVKREAELNQALLDADKERQRAEKADSTIKGRNQTITEMSALIRAAQDRAEKAEAERDEAQASIAKIIGTKTAKERLRKRDIEQQIKGLESLLRRTCPVSGPVIRDGFTGQVIRAEIEQLRKELTNA